MGLLFGALTTTTTTTIQTFIRRALSTLNAESEMAEVARWVNKVVEIVV